MSHENAAAFKNGRERKFDQSLALVVLRHCNCIDQQGAGALVPDQHRHPRTLHIPLARCRR